MIRHLRSPNPYPRRRLTLAAIAVAAVLGTLPASGQSDTRDMANRLQRLENELQTLSREVYRGGARPPATGGAAPAMTGNVAADFEVRLQRLESEMQTLTGRYEEAGFQVAQLREQLAKMQQDIEFRLSRLEQGQGGGLSAGAAPSAGEAAPAAEPAAPAAHPTGKPAAANSNAAPTAGGFNLPNGSAQEQYDFAFNLLRQAEYDKAELAFTRFIEANSASPLASNAQYWLGESFYVRGKYKEAAVAFAEGYQKYPKSTKAPDSLLKLSLSLSAMKANEDACAALTELNRAYKTTAPQTILRRAEAEKNRLKCK
ncbi:tol-pal system protein YbgF [Niveispirillum cyanobacteriorum]|uniref:Cell division coordinator CpoB n=1 Tax=Niveispirillum cyanobacteriorum TaxID=1612173 RepID=A0A2K9NCJ2_9PROT|nr:tol-pal system protein YbgF [Niveispirillum cyanobacteriorum]AUN29895.1 tol-pal system protein YbgF [Niveispirillum cyanobacteriorum]GGE59772.1 tol-pal system protein YbgF [Niveispirillum cyanobacteriorum]